MTIEQQLPSASGFPPKPYLGLSFFTDASAGLFGERDDEIYDVVTLLTLPTTRLLILQGLSGVGKSSFLRAGLMPALGKNELFECPKAPTGHFDLVRCTDDPLSNLLQQLVSWNTTARSLPRTSDRAKSALLGELHGASGEDRLELADKLLRALVSQAHASSCTLVLTIDQAEEVLTLNDEADNQKKRGAFFLFLRRLCNLNIDLKLIVSLRTEYYGQFCAALGTDPVDQYPTLGFNKHALIDPRREWSGAGPTAFLLQPIRDSKKLKNIILKPTGRESIDGLGAPFDKYRFEYSPSDGVVDEIVSDLLARHSTISTLPVLQVVCRSLYDHVVVERKGNEISKEDYIALGRVGGRISAYIDDAIRAAVAKASFGAFGTGGQTTFSRILEYWTNVGTVTERWRNVLCDLVGRSEGGATTSTIQDEAKLLQRADSAGFPLLEATAVLADLADENQGGVLRQVVSGKLLRYSLIHDSIASVLADWQPGFVQRLKHRETSKKRLQFVGMALSGAILVFVGAEFYVKSIQQPRDVLAGATRALGAAIDIVERSGSRVSNTTPEQAAREVLAALDFLQAADFHEWTEGYFIRTEEAADQLRRFVDRSPSVLIDSVDALGISSDGDRLAVMVDNHQQAEAARDVSQQARAARDGPQQAKAARDAARGRLAREGWRDKSFDVRVIDLKRGGFPLELQVGLRLERGNLDFVPPAIGFMRFEDKPDGTKPLDVAQSPVVFSRGIFYYFKNAVWLSKKISEADIEPRPASVDFMQYGVPIITLEGIRIRTLAGASRVEYLLSPPRNTDGKWELSSRSCAVDGSRRYFPIVSGEADYYAALARGEGDAAPSLPATPKIGVGTIHNPGETTEDLQISPEDLERSNELAMGFSQDASWVLLKQSETAVVAFPNRARPEAVEQRPLFFQIPETGMERRYGGTERPELAAYIGTQAKLAWPIRGGILVTNMYPLDQRVEGPKGEGQKVLVSTSTHRIYLDGMRPDERPTRLRFSHDGRYLIEVTTRVGENAASEVRVWDLAPEAAFEKSKELADLRMQACRVIRGYGSLVGGRTAETIFVGGRRLKDPCFVEEK